MYCASGNSSSTNGSSSVLRGVLVGPAGLAPPRRVLRLEVAVQVAQPVEPVLAWEAVALQQPPLPAHDGLHLLQEVGLLAARDPGVGIEHQTQHRRPRARRADDEDGRGRQGWRCPGLRRSSERRIPVRGPTPARSGRGARPLPSGSVSEHPDAPFRPSSSAPTGGVPASARTTPTRTCGAAPRASRSGCSSRAPTAKGVVLGYDRRFSSEFFAAAAAEVLLAYDIPVAIAAERHPHPDDLVRGGRAGLRVRRDDHRVAQPWTDNGFKIKSPSGAAASRGHPVGGRAASSATTLGRTPPTRPIADAEAAGLVRRFDPYPGYVEYVGRSLDLERTQGRRRVGPGRPHVGLGCGLDPATPRRRQDPGPRDPLRAQPVVRGRQPGAHRAQHQRGAGHPRRAVATTSGCCSMATPTGRARRTSGARSSTSSRSWAC